MTRRSPEGAFGIAYDQIPRIPREAEVLVYADAITYMPTPAVLRAEATALDTIAARRGQPGVTVDWTVTTRRVAATDEHPNGEQPGGATTRHPWQPGTPLPPHTLYATCTATRTAAGF